MGQGLPPAHHRPQAGAPPLRRGESHAAGFGVEVMSFLPFARLPARHVQSFS
jgi:hypothetical protein